MIAPDGRSRTAAASLRETGQIFVARAPPRSPWRRCQTPARHMAWLREFAPDIVITRAGSSRRGRGWLRLLRGPGTGGAYRCHRRRHARPAGRAWAAYIRRGAQAGACQLGGRRLSAAVQVFAPSGMDWAECQSGAAGLGPDAQAELLSNPQIIGCAVEHYGQHCHGEPAIVFACNHGGTPDRGAAVPRCWVAVPTRIGGSMDGSERRQADGQACWLGAGSGVGGSDR